MIELLVELGVSNSTHRAMHMQRTEYLIKFYFCKLKGQKVVVVVKQY